MQGLEDCFRETRADVADCFVGVGCGVVAGEEEGAEDGGAFAAAVVGAQHDEVEGVAHAGEVIFFDLWERVSDVARGEWGMRISTFSQFLLRLLGS